MLNTNDVCHASVHLNESDKKGQQCFGELINWTPLREMRWKVENYLWAPWCELPRRKRMRWVPPCLKTIFQSFHIFNIDNPQCWKVRNNPFLPWHLKSWFTFCRFGTVHFCTYKVQRFKILFYPKKALLWWQKKSFFEGKSQNVVMVYF